jgi:hypothetical protein
MLMALRLAVFLAALTIAFSVWHAMTGEPPGRICVAGVFRLGGGECP